MAAFLAELATAGSHSAIVLDDPVCSLGHRWRQKVAERLVGEAATRQVIIFTHDLVFLLSLLECAGEKGVPVAQSYVFRGKDAGLCLGGTPWIAMSVRQRLGYLKQAIQEARSACTKEGPDTYAPLARRVYGLLRETCERAVEEVLLNKVVMRFGRQVQTQRLHPLTDIAESDVQFLDSVMTKCSKHLEGHDQPGAVNEPVPEPDEVAGDIRALEDWVAEMRKRGRN